MFIVLLIIIFFIAFDIILTFALCKAAGKEDTIYYDNKDMIKKRNIDK